MEKTINPDLNAKILVAAGKQDKAELERLLEEGGDINAQNVRGATPLMSAISAKDEDFAIWLVGRGANPNTKTLTGEFPMLSAATRGMEALTTEMLKRGGNPNDENNLGSNPLMEACLHRNPKVAQILLSGGADPNRRSVQGTTPLLNASRNHDPDLVELLLKNGANPNDADSYGVPALIAAASVLSRYDPKEDMPKSVETIKVLLKYGANPNIPAKSGNTAIAQASMALNRDAVMVLLKAGANPNSCSTAGVQGEMTPLMLAAVKRDVDLVDRLLDAGADPEFKNSKGETALQYALWARAKNKKEQEDGVKTVSLLLKRGAKPTPAGQMGIAHYALAVGDEALLQEAKSMGVLDQKDKDGLTALHLSLLMRKASITEKLLELGADPNAKDNDEMAPLAVLARNPSQPGVEQLIEMLKQQEDPKAKAEGERLYAELKESILKLAKLMVEKGADPNAQDKDGETALTHAMRPYEKGAVSREFLDLLVDLGSDISLSNESGDTAFLLAVKIADQKLSLDWAKKLIAEGKGELVENAILDLAWTAPEHPQAVESLRPVLSALMELGAKVDAKDDDGQTPLIVAAATNQEALLNLLLDLGADINLSNNAGEVPLMQAIANAHPNITRMLLDRGADYEIKNNEHEDSLAMAYKYQSATIITQISDARKAKVYAGRKASAG